MDTQASSIKSYRNILKSTSLIGGASFITILVGMVRTKFVALLLGPAGVGLIGMYEQVISLVSTLTGMGLGLSGVRQIAEAAGTDDDERIARTVITIRRTAWMTGVLGLLVMVIFCVPISRMTFDSDDYARSIALLGITLLSGAIAGGQGSIINGTRRIGDLARISVIGAISGTLISIPCFYLWQQAGIVPSLILSAIAALATSWWFAGKVPVKAIALPWSDSCSEARQLILLGISFMLAGSATILSLYLIRILMLRQFGLADVGIYQSAFNLSGMLAQFVLTAMVSDYYPRLTAVAGDNVHVHRIVNEQSQVSILLSLPGLAVMMVFAPVIIKLFYAASFITAVPIMRWCILGILGRVFSWPIGFVMAAKGYGKLYLGTEIFACSLHVAAVYLLTRIWGLEGAGVAFMVLYVVYTALMLFVMRRLVGATWDRQTLKLTLLATIVMTVLMLNCTLTGNMTIQWLINLAILAVVTYLCFGQLSKISDIGLNALLDKLRLKNKV